jgi:hypothetical protein
MIGQARPQYEPRLWNALVTSPLSRVLRSYLKSRVAAAVWEAGRRPWRHTRLDGVDSDMSDDRNTGEAVDRSPTRYVPPHGWRRVQPAASPKAGY